MPTTLLLGTPGSKILTQALLHICITSKIFRFYSKQGQQQNKEVMPGLDSDDETDSDGTIDDKYNLCKEKGPSRRSLAIQSGCKVNRHYLLIIMTLVVEYQFWLYKIGKFFA